MSKIYVDEIHPKTAGGIVATPTRPVWFGKLTSAQTMTRASIEKLTGFTTDKIDTVNAFDGTTFTVPSGMGGIYTVTYNIFCDFTPANSDLETIEGRIYINDASVFKQRFQNATTRDTAYYPLSASLIVNLSAGDTVDVRGYLVDSSGDNAQVNATHTTFGGYFIG